MSSTLARGTKTFSPDGSFTSSTRAREPEPSACGSAGNAVAVPIIPKYGSRMIRTATPTRRVLPLAGGIGRPHFARRFGRPGNHDFRSQDARANLRRAAQGRFAARTRSEQIKRSPGHGDFAETLGDDQRQAGVFRSCGRHPQVITEEVAQVLVVYASGDDGRQALLDAACESLGGHPSAADRHAAAHLGSNQIARQRLLACFAGHADRSESFPPNAKNSLYE